MQKSMFYKRLSKEIKSHKHQINETRLKKKSAELWKKNLLMHSATKIVPPKGI
jgi:hypothetical protein